MYDKAYCLVLDKRLAKWKEVFQPQLQAVGIDPYMFLAGNGELNLQYDHYDVFDKTPYYGYNVSIDYPTWYHRPNAYNAWLCHKKMMEMALSTKQDRILLLEDDTFPEEDYKSILDECRDFLDNNPWDMLYLGCYSHDNLLDTGHKYVHKMMGGGGFHGVILNTTIMEILVKFLPIGPYDWICGKHIHKNFNCYAISPCILSQADGFSHVEGSILKKPSRNVK